MPIRLASVRSTTSGASSMGAGDGVKRLSVQAGFGGAHEPLGLRVGSFSQGDPHEAHREIEARSSGRLNRRGSSSSNASATSSNALNYDQNQPSQADLAKQEGSKTLQTEADMPKQGKSVTLRTEEDMPKQGKSVTLQTEAEPVTQGSSEQPSQDTMTNAPSTLASKTTKSTIVTKKTLTSQQSVASLNDSAKIPSISANSMFKADATVGAANGLEFFYVLVNLSAFKFLVNITIMINAIQMGAAADLRSDDWKRVWLIFDNAFAAIFTVEMVLKILGLGKNYFRDGWNILDFAVVWISILDCWIIGQSEDGDSGLGAVRIFRLLRLLRMTKVLRVVPELVAVIEGIIKSMRAMFWVLLLLAIIIYAFAIVCVEVIGSSSSYIGRTSDTALIEKQMVENFNSWVYFGSLARSMVSLFSMILLAEWSAIARPIWEVQMPMILVFVFLVIITTFGVLNVIIGIIVERTTAAMNQMREKQYLALKKEQMKTVEKLADIMYNLDVNSDDKISLEEFEAGQHNDVLVGMLKKIDFPIDFRFEEVHHMLDMDGSGGVSKNEFVNGMMRLIYCNQFQRECLLMSSLGQIKAFINKERHERHAVHSDLLNEIQALRADGSRQFDGSSLPTSTSMFPRPHVETEGSDNDGQSRVCGWDCRPSERFQSPRARRNFNLSPRSESEQLSVLEGVLSPEECVVDVDEVSSRLHEEKKFMPDEFHMLPPPAELLSLPATTELKRHQSMRLESAAVYSTQTWEPIDVHCRRRVDQVSARDNWGEPYCAPLDPTVASPASDAPCKLHPLLRRTHANDNQAELGWANSIHCSKATRAAEIGLRE